MNIKLYILLIGGTMQLQEKVKMVPPIMAKSLENFLSQSVFCFTIFLWAQLMCLISVPFIHQAGAQTRQVLASNDVVHFGIDYQPLSMHGPPQSNKRSSRPCTEVYTHGILQLHIYH